MIRPQELEARTNKNFPLGTSCATLRHAAQKKPAGRGEGVIVNAIRMSELSSQPSEPTCVATSLATCNICTLLLVTAPDCSRRSIVVKFSLPTCGRCIAHACPVYRLGALRALFVDVAPTSYLKLAAKLEIFRKCATFCSTSRGCNTFRTMVRRVTSLFKLRTVATTRTSDAAPSRRSGATTSPLDRKFGAIVECEGHTYCQHGNAVIPMSSQLRSMTGWVVWSFV